MLIYIALACLALLVAFMLLVALAPEHRFVLWTIARPWSWGGALVALVAYVLLAKYVGGMCWGPGCI